jgi:hypothetical protein
LEHPFIQEYCETPLQKSQCIVTKKKGMKIKKIPGGEIFKIYSSPNVKYMALGDEKIEDYFIVDDDKIKKFRKKNIINFPIINSPKNCRKNNKFFEFDNVIFDFDTENFDNK